MYAGTSLVTTETKEEINRAILDLLKKVNELSSRIDKLSSTIEALKNETENN